MPTEETWEKVFKFVNASGSALSGIAALAAVMLSGYLYHLTTVQQKAQDARQASQEATQLYRSYLQLTLEKPGLFGKETSHQAAASFVMTTAESIFLSTNDEGWRETTGTMLAQQKDLIEAGQWDCSSMIPEFVAFARKDVGLRISCVR